MQPKINVHDWLVSVLAVLGASVVIDAFHKKILPYFSWGSDLCKICDCYECTTYNDLCDYCADDVREEFNTLDEACKEDEAKPNMSMYN